jgi:hypothetical protein
MVRLPRLFLFTAVLVLPCTQWSVYAADEAPVAAAPAVNPDLKHAAEDFFHYASIGRFDLAKLEGDKVVALNAPAADVLAAFEAVVADRNRRVLPDRRIDLYERVLSWQRSPDLSETGAKLIGIFNKAKKEQSANLNFVEQNVQRLGNGRRAYALAVEQLRESGELAVPVMLRYLNDPAKKDLNVPIRGALHDLGIKALNPLLAATEMKDWNLLPWVLASLGDLGYDNAVPYLVRLAKSNDAPATVKDAAKSALIRLHVADVNGQNAAQLFYELAEKFYYEKASVAAAPGAAEAYVWYWSDQGLVNKVVPAATFNEDMAMRSCEAALKLDATRGDAVSLWLAAGYKREVELPEGKTDPFWEEKHPATHYYAVASGTKGLNPVLARALRDGNAAVALKALKSLQEIVGATNLFISEESVNPVLEAMRFPDRQVRFEAAFAVAQAMPQRAFTAQNRVVLTLAEALAQTGKPNVLVMAPSDKQNALKEQLKQYNVQGGATADAAVAAAASLNGVDVIILYEGDPQIDRLFADARENLRLEHAAKLVIVKASKVASPYAQMALHDPLITVTDEAGVAAGIEEARKRAGELPLDEKVATAYSLRSAELLAKLAMGRGQVLDLALAQPAVLAALDDSRLEISKAAGNVLAVHGSREAEAALAMKSLDEKTPDDQKIHYLKNLSMHAKLHGNQLDSGLIDGMAKLAEASPSLDVKSAAAEVLGALNLRSEQIKALINNQAK